MVTLTLDDNRRQTNMSCEQKKQLSQHDRDVLNRIFSPNLPYADVLDEDQTDTKAEEVVTREEQEAQRLEVSGVEAAEAGRVEDALSLFSQAIEMAPQRASGYNNRAQARRLSNNTPGALDDLNKAIELSGGEGAAACQAYTQRGLIYKLEEREEESLEDFKRAAVLGSAFAKQMVISMNPYAALCNNMMMEMIHKVKQGEDV